jgi:hypothetical protein
MAGCAICFPAEPVAVPALDVVRSLVEESHFIVAVKQCRSCGQRFVSVFCERIDWMRGEDPQTRVLVPVTGAEAEAVDLSGLAALADRTYLVSHWPSGGAQSVGYARGGPIVFPHD